MKPVVAVVLFFGWTMGDMMSWRTPIDGYDADIHHFPEAACWEFK